MKRIRILNLGGGVQSTDLYLEAADGLIEPFDYAITSDTQDEAGSVERRMGLPDPEESFYTHMDWLGTQAAYLDSKSPLIQSSRHGGKGCPILVRTRGQISADLLREEWHGRPVPYQENHRHRFASIPAFTATAVGGKDGQTPRQCTKEYKIEVIDQCIRYELLGLQPGQRLPKDVFITQLIGISWDERSRAVDIGRRFEVVETEEVAQLDFFGGETIINEVTGRRERPNWRCGFPLLEMTPPKTRTDCEAWLAKRVPHKVFGSACLECPFKDDPTWRRHMQPGPTRDFIVQIDHGIRKPGVIVNRGLDQDLYLHRACRPIDQIEFKHENQLGMALECEGGCGL